MYQLQYILPPGSPPANGAVDKSVMEMCAKLKGVDTKGAKVPNSALSLKLFVTPQVASLEIRKREELVYLNFFCFATGSFEELLLVVGGGYQEYNLGAPERPKIPTWIHSIPIAPDLLRENEIVLCQKMTVSFFWAAYTQQLKKSNPMN